MIGKLCAVVAIATGVAACGGEEEDVDRHEVTYHRDLRPVVEESCLPCHESGGIGPFALESYDDLVGSFPLVLPAIESGAMPPWPAADGCHDIHGVRRLPDETVEMFRTWQAIEMPEGREKDYEPPPGDELPPLGEPTLEITMDVPYATHRLQPGEEDELRCFLLPEGIDEESFMRALEVAPSTNTVHHLQVHRVPAESVAAAQEVDAVSAAEGWPCFGDSAEGSYNLFSWHPGAEVIRFGQDEAAYLSEGSRLALQVHFNADAYEVGEPIPEEQTTVRLWLLPQDELPDYVVVRFFLSGGAIFLPPGQQAVDVTQMNAMSDSVVEDGGFIPGEFIGHTPHMHWLGEGFNVTLHREDGEDECLIDVPQWDFDWQLDYWYPKDKYVAFDETDMVTVTCNYDNGPANQPYVGGQQQAPRFVTFGQSSTDEMCLNHTWVRYEREAYLAARGEPGER